MKYKRGKGRKSRRLQKVFKLKKGGGQFSFKGGAKLSPFGNPVPVGFTTNMQVKKNLEKIGFRVGGDR
jgi:hypothetical protein